VLSHGGIFAIISSFTFCVNAFADRILTFSDIYNLDKALALQKKIEALEASKSREVI